MTLKTSFKCDYNVKTKSHLPTSKKGMTKIPLPKKTSLAESLIAQKNTFVAQTLTPLCQRHFWRLGKLARFSHRDVTMARHLEPTELASSSLPPGPTGENQQKTQPTCRRMWPDSNSGHISVFNHRTPKHNIWILLKMAFQNIRFCMGFRGEHFEQYITAN